MFIVMCSVIKIDFAVKNMQPIGDHRAVMNEIRADQRAVVEMVQMVIVGGAQPRRCQRSVMITKRRNHGKHGARARRRRPK